MVERGRDRRGTGETERRGRERKEREREHFVCFLFKPVLFHWTSKASLAASVHTCLSQDHCTRCVYPLNLAMKVEGSRCTVCVDIRSFCAVF